MSFATELGKIKVDRTFLSLMKLIEGIYPKFLVNY